MGAATPTEILTLQRKLPKLTVSPRAIIRSQHTPTAEGNRSRSIVALSTDGLLVVEKGQKSAGKRSFLPSVVSQSLLNFSSSFHPQTPAPNTLPWGFWPIVVYLEANIADQALLAVSTVSSTSIFSSDHRYLKVQQKLASQHHQTRRPIGWDEDNPNQQHSYPLVLPRIRQLYRPLNQRYDPIFLR